MSMRHIRPWQLFQHLHGSHEVHYTIPRHRGTESETIMALETLCLVAAARIVEAKSILELGTGLGYNALHLAMNTEAVVWTVDKDEKPFVFQDTDYEKRIVSMQEDVRTLTPPTPFDMVFCDVNYSHETTEAATALAFACNPKAIAWHDYGRTDNLSPHQDACLEKVAETHDLYHVQDSWTVLWFKEGLQI